MVGFVVLRIRRAYLPVHLLHTLVVMLGEVFGCILRWLHPQTIQMMPYICIVCLWAKIATCRQYGEYSDINDRQARYKSQHYVLES